MNLRRRVLFSATALWLLVAVACVNLDEVTKFAASANSADSALSNLAADLIKSCQRDNQYIPQGGHPRDCAPYDHRKDLGAAQSVLLNYVGALGNLASDKLPTFQGDLSKLPTTLKPAGFNDNQVKATSSLASAVLEAVVNGYRRKKLADLIGESNGNVQVVCAGLEDIIGKDYLQLLNNEEADMDDYYKTALMSASGDSQSLSKVLVQDLWDRQKAALTEKKTAANAYVNIMQNIASGHQKLYDHRNDFSLKQLVDDLGPEIQAIATSANDVYKAFK